MNCEGQTRRYKVGAGPLRRLRERERDLDFDLLEPLLLGFELTEVDRELERLSLTSSG